MQKHHRNFISYMYSNKCVTLFSAGENWNDDFFLGGGVRGHFFLGGIPPKIAATQPPAE